MCEKCKHCDGYGNPKGSEGESKRDLEEKEKLFREQQMELVITQAKYRREHEYDNFIGAVVNKMEYDGGEFFTIRLGLICGNVWDIDITLDHYDNVLIIDQTLNK